MSKRKKTGSTAPTPDQPARYEGWMSRSKNKSSILSPNKKKQYSRRSKHRECYI